MKSQPLGLWRMRQSTDARIVSMLAVLVSCTGGCVTEIVDAPPDAAGPIEVTSVLVPLRGSTGHSGPVDQYYTSVLAQLQEALEEQDLQRMRGLIATHSRDDAPSWARERLVQFGNAAVGLELQLALVESADLVREGDDVAGAPQSFRLQLAGPSGREVRSTKQAELRFLARVRIVDRDSFGDVSQRSSSIVLTTLGRPAVADGAGWDIPFATELSGAGVVLREIEVRVELLPGNVEVDGRLAMVGRATLVTKSFVQYPPGVDPIRQKPLVTLQNALQLGDREHYPHIYLASHFIGEADREAAIERLMNAVRLGDAGLAQVAMAGLAVITGERIPVGDRDAWLAWRR